MQNISLWLECIGFALAFIDIYLHGFANRVEKYLDDFTRANIRSSLNCLYSDLMDIRESFLEAIDMILEWIMVKISIVFGLSLSLMVTLLLLAVALNWIFPSALDTWIGIVVKMFFEVTFWFSSLLIILRGAGILFWLFCALVLTLYAIFSVSVLMVFGPAKYLLRLSNLIHPTDYAIGGLGIILGIIGLTLEITQSN